MNGENRHVVPSLNGDADLPERLWAYDDFAIDEDEPATDYAAGLTNLRFIRGAVRRGARLWIGTAVAGLLCALGMLAAAPPSYQASTSILITHNPSDNAVDAIQTDLALAASNTVAERTISKLGLQESVGTFIAAATITPITDRVLRITISAPSSDQAVLRAETLATEFLQLRAQQLRAQQQPIVAALTKQINAAKQQVDSITAQIKKLPAQPASAAEQAALAKLEAKRSEAVNELSTLQQAEDATKVNTDTIIVGEISGSRVLDAATPIHHSKIKYAAIYAVMGLFLGLVLGLGIVIVRALLSDHLRRRDDIAEALGATVDLSVGAVGGSRWLPVRRERRIARTHDMQRLVTHLSNVVPERSSGAATLAIVPVDNDDVAARALVMLALSAARNGQQVIVADLCHGAPAARLLGVKKPGVQSATADGIQLVVVIPDRDDVMPTGPVHGATPRGAHTPPSDALVAAYDSVDLLLALVPLDPAFGVEHLVTWAANAVVMVTAGQSSWVRINTVSEMIRRAGALLVSAILTAADRDDESLGTTTPRHVGAVRVRDS